MEAITAACVIASYGDSRYWTPLADRAAQSAGRQTLPFDEVIRLHLPEGRLQQARNEAASHAKSHWLCFLDADDELDPHYVEAMGKVHGDIKRPATLGVIDGIEDDYPVMIERGELRVRNFIVIGAFFRREQFEAVGGFSDDPVLEDWDLWIRMHLDGAEIVDVPEAIYRVHVRDGSRNTPRPTPSELARHGKVYSEIKNRYRDRWNVIKERPVHADT